MLAELNRNALADLYAKGNDAVTTLQDFHARVAASGRPATTPDIGKELATWEWRCATCNTATYLTGHGGIIDSGPCGKACPCTSLQVYVILAGERIHLGSAHDVFSCITDTNDFRACAGCKTPRECEATHSERAT